MDDKIEYDYSRGPEWISRTQKGYTETYCSVCRQDEYAGHANWCPWLGVVVIKGERLKEIVGFVIRMFNHGNFGPGRPPILGEGRFAVMLGVNLLAANEIAQRYADNKDWFDYWLTEKLRKDS